MTLALAACAPGKGETDGADGSESGTAETGATDISGTETGQPTSEASGSSGTGVAEETTQTSDPTGGDCVDVPTPLGLDEVSPLGFTAAEALAGKTGLRMGTVTWTPDGFVHDDLKGVAWTVSFGVDYGSGTIQFIESNPGVGGSGGEGSPEPIFCESRLEITVQLTLDSEGGELIESREVVVVATSADLLELRQQQLVPPGFMGTLTPEQVIAPPMTLDSFDVSVALTAAEATGSLNGSVSDPMLGSVGYGTLASLTAGAPP